MKQETERLNMEIEVLQGKIFLHNETKDAWDTILRNAGSESHAAYLDFANFEAERLNGEIEAVQEEIRRHNETRDAWDTVARNPGRPSRIYQGVTYMKGEDVQWHLQRLDMEIEALQGEIHLHNETKDAWDTILRDTGSELQAAYLDLANTETARLNREIEAVQERIRCHLETRGAWDTILRNVASESRIYQGATYRRGWDGQWHLQQAQASESNEVDDQRWADNAVSKVNSVRQALLNACERTLRIPQKSINIPMHGKEQFQTLGLR
jgi:hypothetical protein